MIRIRLLRFKALLVIALSLIVPLVGAMAQEVSWQTIRIRGEGKAAICNPDTVFTSYIGNSAAFVFTNLGVNITAGTNHQAGAEFGACRVRTRMLIPQGYYLAGISQATQAGVIKSAGARGAVRARLFLQSKEQNDGGASAAFPGLGEDGQAIDRMVRFAPKDEMSEPLLDLNGSFLTSPAGAKYICQYSRQRPITIDMVFRASVLGEVKKAGGSVIISVDSSDVQLHLGARLGRCP